jgi:hypothetical protein
MSKTIGSILTAAGSITAYVPGGQAIGAALIVAGTAFTLLDRPKSEAPEQTETAIRSPTPVRVSGYGKARHHLHAEPLI